MLIRQALPRKFRATAPITPPSSVGRCFFDSKAVRTRPERDFFVQLSKPILRACFFLAIASVFVFVAPASAQGPKGDVFFGYSRTGSDMFYAGAGGLNGWEANLHVKAHVPFLGGEADFAHYGLGAAGSVPRTTTFLFGPRLTLGAGGPRIYLHALVGGEHSASGTGISGGTLAYALGGGLDLPIFPSFAWRFGGDYLRAPDQSPSGASHGRFTTGLVFRF